MNQRPGFMLYFELSPALETLDDRAAGRLLKALMAYAQYGELRELDGMESLAFLLMRGRIDRDAETYREKCRKNAYAVYVRDVRRAGGEPLEYEDWVSNDIERYPTTTTTPTATPNTNTKSISIPAAAQPSGSSHPPAVNGDTAWVVPFLEQERERRTRMRN